MILAEEAEISLAELELKSENTQLGRSCYSMQQRLKGWNHIGVILDN
jgi:hypothetical protein